MKVGEGDMGDIFWPWEGGGELEARQRGDHLHQTAPGLHVGQALQETVAVHPEHRGVVTWGGEQSHLNTSPNSPP